MNPPTFADGPKVPLMVESVIDVVTVRQLFADLQNSAEIHGVREKGNPAHYAAPTLVTLEAASQRLLAGTTRALQINYRFDGQEWTDTLRASPNGFHLVRCRHETP